MMHYDNIYTVRENNRTFYIGHGFGQGSTLLPWQEVRAFEVEENRLILPRIFPENSYNIFCEFDISKFKDGARIPTIKVKEKDRQILVPIENGNGGFTGKYQKLILTNGCYKVKSARANASKSLQLILPLEAIVLPCCRA